MWYWIIGGGFIAAGVIAMVVSFFATPSDFREYVEDVEEIR